MSGTLGVTWGPSQHHVKSVEPADPTACSVKSLLGTHRMSIVWVHCGFVSLDLRTLQLVASCEGQG